MNDLIILRLANYDSLSSERLYNSWMVKAEDLIFQFSTNRTAHSGFPPSEHSFYKQETDIQLIKCFHLEGTADRIVGSEFSLLE